MAAFAADRTSLRLTEADRKVVRIVRSLAVMGRVYLILATRSYPRLLLGFSFSDLVDCQDCSAACFDRTRMTACADCATNFAEAGKTWGRSFCLPFDRFEFPFRGLCRAAEDRSSVPNPPSPRNRGHAAAPATDPASGYLEILQMGKLVSGRPQLCLWGVALFVASHLDQPSLSWRSIILANSRPASRYRHCQE